MAIHEFEVVAEHADQVLLQAHHQRVHPAVEDGVGPFPAHLGGIAGRHILHMQRRADHGAGDAEPLGAVALHLGAEHQLWRRLGHRLLNRQVVVADQGLQTQFLGGGAHLPGQLAAVSTQAHHLKAQLLAGDAGGGDRVGGIAEDEHPLAGEVGGIHRARIPGEPRGPLSKTRGFARPCGALRLQPQHLFQFRQEGLGGGDADRHRFDGGHAEAPLQPAAHGGGHLRIEADIGIGRGDPHQIGGPGPQRCGDGHIDAPFAQQPGDLAHVIAAAEPEQGGADQVDPRPAAFFLPTLRRRFRSARLGQLVFQQAPHQLVEGFRCSPVLLFGVGRQLQAHDRQLAEAHAHGQGTGLVLDQFGGAALAHEQGLRLEPLHRLGDRALHQLGGVAAQVAGLEGGVGHGRASIPPLDHREQQVGVGVALGGMQHVVHPLHRGGDPHGAHMGRAFIGPEGEFHGEESRGAVGPMPRVETGLGGGGPGGGRSWGTGAQVGNV